MSSPPGRVVVVLVSHDGARWLPGVLDGLAEQGDAWGRVDRVLAVDTGSRDESRDLLAGHGLGVEVLEAPSSTSYPAAVRLATEHLGAADGGAGGAPAPEWLWLLHDDSRPAPGALAALLAAADERPDVDLLGPKLREWPSLRRLLEVGVTISGTGRRETGLERGEYDQGQHDDQHEVLAVNTAGLLVRRSVLAELGGLDEQLPMFGNDLDLGWRAAAAGHTTLVVPRAVVFHAEAAHRGVRRTALTGRHTHYQERRAALWTLLVNGRGRWLPLRVVRLTLGTVVRMLGFVLVRSPGEALDDLAALVSVLSRPGALLAARRERRPHVTTPERATELLAPPWLPYRHGLDFVGDVAAAVTNQASDVAERRRAAAAELDPSSMAATRVRAEDDEDELTDTGAVARFLTNPVALALTAVVVLALVAAAPAFGTVVGGALLPTPDDAASWWRLHVDAQHPLGFGTDVPAPPIVLPLALLGSVVGTTAAVSLLLLLAVPFSLWGSWRFLRVAGRLVSPLGTPRWILVGGATAYALVPVTSGAWGSGRLGVVVATALLPWLAHAALGFADPEADRRWRAGFRVAALLTLTAMFAPVAWWLALALLLVVVGGGLVVARTRMLDRDVSGPPVTAVLAPLVLLSPWWVAALTSGSAGQVVLDSGRLPDDAVGRADLLLGRLTADAAPVWVGGVLVVLALLALVPRATRIPVTLCWLVAAVALLVGALLGLVDVDLVAGTTPAGLGAVVAVVQACLVTAAVLGGQGALRARREEPARVAVVAASLLAAVVPAMGLAWFLVGDDDLGSTVDSDVPAYMTAASRSGDEHGILLVRGSVEAGLTYTVQRGDGTTLGEAEVLALSPADEDAEQAVGDLLSRPTGSAVDAVGALGVEWVMLPEPVDGRVASALDATSGLVQASSRPGTRAWQVNRPLDAGDATGGQGAVHTTLLVVQGLGVLLVLVLCLPTLRARRTDPDEEDA